MLLYWGYILISPSIRYVKSGADKSPSRNMEYNLKFNIAYPAAKQNAYTCTNDIGSYIYVVKNNDTGYRWFYRE